jgi:hypothetical protein
MPEGFKIASAWVEVSPDTEGFKEQLQAALDEAVAGVEADVKVGLDTSELDAKADDVRAKVDDLGSATAEPRVSLDAADLDAKVDDAKAKLDDLDGKEARPEVTLEAADLDAKSEDAKAKLDDLDARRADPRLTLDTTEFDERLTAAQAALDAFAAQSGGPSLGAASTAGGGGGGGGGGEGGGFLGALTLGVGALMPGLAGAATGAGLLGVTGGLALGGVAKALSAAHQSALNVGLTGAQLASTNFDNQVQVQQAQQTVTTTREQAGQDAVTAAQSIASAETNLAEVTRNAAQAQVQALQSVKQAEQGVEQANYGLSEAQYNLTQAWVQAREQITQLDDQLSDSKLSVSAAQLAIQQALYNQRLVDQNAYSTSIDRQQAALAVLQAQQQLKDASDQETAAAYAANLANKQGVAGSQTVIQAKQGVVAATYAQTDAQAQYSEAQQTLTVTELNNAAQVQQAQRQLAAAQEQAAFQQKMDAQQVAIAERNVTNTIKEQQLAMAATKSTSNEAANEFAKDMARLTPTGRAFVNQILGMKGAYDKLRDSAQNAVLPGMSVWLTGLATLMPEITKGVTQMGQAIGKSFASFGKQMATPQFAHVLDGLIGNGIKFANIVLPAFATFVQELAKIGSKKGAVDGIAGVLAGIANGLTKFAGTISHFQGPINSFLQAAGHIISNLGPGLGTIIGLVATALAPLTRYLNAHPNGTVAKVIGSVVAGLLTMKTLVKWGKAPFEAISAGYKMITGIPGKMSQMATKIGKAWSGLSSIPGKVAGVFSKVFGPGGVWDGIRLRGMQAAEGISGAWGKTSTFFTTTLPGYLSTAGQKLGQFASNGVQAIQNMASKIGAMMGNAATSVKNFVTGYGKETQEEEADSAEMAEENGANATAVEAENEAEEASAVEAGTVEDGATGGITIAIGLLVTAIIYLATHWKQVWGDIKTWAEDAWTFIYDGFGKYLLLLLGPAGLIALGLIELAQHWNSIWGGIKSTVEDVWGGIKSGAEGFVSDLGQIWGKLEDVFKTPVNFLITSVYTDGIENLWNRVVNKVGLGSIALPDIPKLAGGGVLPGYAPGHDSIPAVLSPGEGVLVPEAVQAIGPETVHGLNATYGHGRKSGPHAFAGGGIAGDDDQHKSELGKELKKQLRKRGVEKPAEHGAEHAVMGFSGGGIAGLAKGIWHGVTSTISKTYDIGKIVAALATGNTSALTNALDAFVGTKATGDLGQMMLGLPKTLISRAAGQIVNLLGFGGGHGQQQLPGGSSGAVGSLPENWKAIAQFLSTHGFSKFAAAGVAGNIDAESGGNPEILEIGGGGGGGLIQWTPYPPGYITGNAQADLMTQLNAILSWGGGPGLVNRATSASNAAQIYQDYYERPANLTSSLPQRMASANAVYKAMGWGTFDEGGIATGMGMLPKGTPLPERVLSPRQTDLFERLTVALERDAAAPSSLSTPMGGEQVVQNFYGSALPNAEEKAAMKRELALALSG